MPTFQMQTTVRSCDLHGLRARCDGCDAPRPVEERTRETALWLVTQGAFELRDRIGRRVADPTCAIVLSPDEPFTIRHPAGPDVCLSLRGPLIDALADRRELHLDPAAHAKLVSAVRSEDALAVAEAIASLVPGDVRPDRDLAHALALRVRLTFAQSLSLTELVEPTGASVFHACRVFRAATGQTLSGYRREVRLRHALAMLVDGDEPLTEIASATGFASQSHLTNVFRSRFRSTPGRVRAARRLAP